MKFSREESERMIHFLRFRNEDPKFTTTTYMSYKSIAKFLNKSIAFVQ